jgi:hypothetical protein
MGLDLTRQPLKNINGIVRLVVTWGDETMKCRFWPAFGAALIVAALTTAASVGSAAATTIDFSSYPFYTPVSSVDGVSFALYGGPGGGTPVTGSFGTASLGNSPTGDYPTSEGILIQFSAPASSVSFTFDNFGDNTGFAPSFEKAFAGVTLTDNQNIGGGCYIGSFCTVSVVGTGITSLYVDNGSGGNYSWEYGIGELTFTAATPLPSTWVMMLAGLAGFGFFAYRGSKNRSAAIAAA